MTARLRYRPTSRSAIGELAFRSRKSHFRPASMRSSTMRDRTRRECRSTELPYERWKRSSTPTSWACSSARRPLFRIMKDHGPARRAHHQQRVDLGSRPAPGLCAVHVVQARCERSHAHHRARRPQARTFACCQIDIGTRDDRACGAHVQRGQAGNVRSSGADDRRR